MDAWALTDHGNGNGLAHARSAAVKLQKKGVKYRQLYGVEFYFVSSLSQWREDYETHKQEVKDAKEKKRSKKSDEDDVEQGGHVVEDESETKAEQTSEKPEWQRRYHLVAVAKNYEGLANINRLVKASFKDGFYRYPRIDFDMIEKWGKGIVWSSGCIGGYLARIVSKGEKLGKSRAQILSDLEEACGEFQTRVDPDSFFLELQFNKLDFQHLVNGYLIDLSKKTGIKLVSTCDSHYPSPDKWEARELYKKLGWMGDKLDKGALPKFEDLKCELYPKNAVQMWDEYKKGLESHQEVYEGSEELVRDSIERTHDIAWQMCEDTWVDTSPKLPHFGKPGNSAMKQLVSLLKKKMSEQGFDNDQRYVDRLKEELTVVKAKKFEDYFLTLHAIFQRSTKRCLSGPARGSGSGSLINYLLEITHVDPVKYDLLFSRFINMGRKGFPDVDCLLSTHLVMTPTGYQCLYDISVGDVIVDSSKNHKRVTHVVRRMSSTVDVMIDVYVKTRSNLYGVIVADANHRLLSRKGEDVKVKDLVVGDELMSSDDDFVTVVSIELHRDENVMITDITVEDTSTFFVVPFDVVSFQKNDENILASSYAYGIDTDVKETFDVQEGFSERSS